jgi:hypothetical protein
MSNYFIYEKGDTTTIHLPDGKIINITGSLWWCVNDHRIALSDPCSFEDYENGVYCEIFTHMMIEPWSTPTTSDDEYNEYCKKHENEMACVIYEIDGGEFTTEDIMNSPSYDIRYVFEKITYYTVTVPVIVNGERIEYEVTAELRNETKYFGITDFDFEFKGLEFHGCVIPNLEITKLSEANNDNCGNQIWGLRVRR